MFEGQEMAKNRRPLTVDLRKIIVAELESGMTQKALSVKYGVTPKAIRRWREKLRGGEPLGRGHDIQQDKVVALEQEVRMLREKIGEMTMEMELLKKLRASARRLKEEDSCVISGLDWDPSRKPAK